MEYLLQIKRWLYQVWMHNYAEQLRINRAVIRQKFGVAQNDLPYPGAVVDSNKPTTITNNAASGLVKGLLLGASLIGGGGVGALGLSSLLKPSLPTPSVPIVIPEPTRGQAYEAIYEQQQPDGSWKILKREPLK